LVNPLSSPPQRGGSHNGKLATDKKTTTELDFVVV